MTSYNPVIKNGASGAILYIALEDAVTVGRFKANPTLAAGDVKVVIDGGASANPSTLPSASPASSKFIKVTLSQAEVNGDNIAVLFSDQTTPPEWNDLIINIQTVARQFDDLAYPATSGRSLAVDASGRVDVGSFGGSAGTFASGRPEVNTTHAAGTAWGSGAITAASIAADAITAAKVADGTIDAATFAASAINAAAIASGAITSAKFAAGAIDNAAIAADAIGASELAADAVAEIQSGLSTLTAAGVRTAVGLASANLDTQLAVVQADTDDIQTRLPAALVGGRMDASVGAMAANTVTAAALAADAGAEIATAVLTTQMTESYAADGVAPTLAQAIFALQQFQQEKSIAGVTLTVKKLDGSTTAMTFTTDSATAPTSITRAA